MLRSFALFVVLVCGGCASKAPPSTPPQKACQDGDLDVCLGTQRCVGERQCVEGKWSACVCEPNSQPMAGSPAPIAGSPAPVAGKGGSIAPLPQGGMGGNNPPQGGMGGTPPQGGTGGSTPIMCPSGFTLQQGTCQDIDECATNNGGCGSLDCVNEPGRFSCAAPDATWRNVEVQAAEVTPGSLVQTQSVTCRVTFHNNGAQDYVVPRLVVTLREPGETNFGGRGTDILDLNNVRLPGNDGQTFTPTFEFRTDRSIGAWRCYGTHQDNAGGWHDGESTNVQVALVHIDAIPDSFFSWHTFWDGEPIHRLEGYDATQRFVNPHNFPVQITEMRWALRSQPGQHQTGPYLDLTGGLGAGTVSGEFSVTGERLMRTSDPLGSNYELYPTWRDKYGLWHDLGSRFLSVVEQNPVPITVPTQHPNETSAQITGQEIVNEGNPGARILVVSGVGANPAVRLVVSRGLECQSSPNINRYPYGLGTSATVATDGSWTARLHIMDWADQSLSIGEVSFDVPVPNAVAVLDTCRNYPGVVVVPSY